MRGHPLPQEHFRRFFEADPPRAGFRSPAGSENVKNGEPFQCCWVMLPGILRYRFVHLAPLTCRGASLKSSLSVRSGSIPVTSIRSVVRSVPANRLPLRLASGWSLSSLWLGPAVPPRAAGAPSVIVDLNPFVAPLVALSLSCLEMVVLQKRRVASVLATSQTRAHSLSMHVLSGYHSVLFLDLHRALCSLLHRRCRCVKRCSHARVASARAVALSRRLLLFCCAVRCADVRGRYIRTRRR